MGEQQPIDAFLLEHAADAVIAIDADRMILSWNRGAEDIYGFTAAEAVGRPLLDLTAPDDQAAETHAHLDHIFDASAGAVGSFEGLRKRKDGLLIYIASTGRRLASNPAISASAAPAVVLSDKDVTHARVSRDSKMLENRFRDVFDLMPDAIVVLNATGRIVLANKQAEDLFGYSHGVLVGEPVECLLPERLRAAHFGHRANYIRHPRVRAMGIGLELHGLRADGVEIPVDVSLSPLETPEGTLVLSAIRNATERRQFETQLRDKNAQLAAAMQAKDRFLATMSHELRTPLNAVIGFTGTLLMRLAGPLTEEQERQLRTIRTSGRHLLSLINDLLDLARMDADKLDLSMERIDCQDIIEAVMTALRPQSDSKGLSVILEMPPAQLMVWTDRRALTQIVTNIAANAVKFCDHGTVRVSLRSLPEAGSGGVAIAVADTGIGIRAEHMPTLFDAFSRLSADGAEREGTGLGLHISKRLADRLGARIEVSSTLGAGSVFTLVLPGE
ncbi:MAG: PAS domain-containing sensor histidine kinase [Pseudomonadota bacterium]